MRTNETVAARVSDAGGAGSGAGLARRVLAAVLVLSVGAWLAGCGDAAGGRAGATEPSPQLVPDGQPQPNVIVVLLDAARADHLSCYGYPRPTTPEIDRIADSGTIFLQTFSQATNTFGYMPSALSSRYLSAPLFAHDAWRYGIQAIRKKPDEPIHTFDEQQAFLPQVLSEAGYRTLLIHNHAFFSPETRIARLFDETIAIDSRGEGPQDGRVFERLFAWLEQHRDERFFVWLHVLSPHEPYLPKPEEAEFLSGLDDETVETVRKRLHNHTDLDVDNWSEESLDAFHGLYDANLRHVDGWVGQLDNRLETLGLARDTLMVITSDHGENLGQHGNYGHGGPPWDAVTHVPLILAWPGVVPPARQLDGLSESVDIAPTILDLAGVALPTGKTMDGTSLVPRLAGRPGGKSEVLVLKKRQHAHEEALRTDTHKLFPGTGELFDLRSDPGETIDVAARERSVFKRLRRRFDEATAAARERFERAVLNGPPDFPFYLPITSFEIGPERLLGTLHERNNERTVEQLERLANAGQASWAVNREYFNHGLAPLPTEGPAPAVTLEAAIPSGRYRVGLLVAAFGRGGSGQRPGPDAVGSGLMVRRPGDDRFRRPASIKRFEASDDEWYVDLGEVTVADDRFVLQLDAERADAAPWRIIRHVAFFPTAASRTDVEEPDAEAFDEKIERLEALGYL